MLKKCEAIIMIVAMIGILSLHTAFSQEKVTEDVNGENFATMISKVNEKVADFGDKLKRTRLGDISKIPDPLGTVAIDQYVKYGTKTAEGTVIYMENGKPVPTRTPISTMDIVSTAHGDEITKFILEAFDNFYKKILPVLTDTCKVLKDSPVRLDSISIEMAPFGVGGSVTIGVNYDSSVFVKEK